MPNFRGRRFTNAHETLIWAARGPESRYRFNYAAMKSLNDDLQMRSDWLIPLCTGGERLRDGDGRQAAPDAEAGGAAAPGDAGLHPPGEVVLDPFLGTGTTAAVAQAARPPLHRHRARRGLCRRRRGAHRRGAAAGGERGLITAGKREQPRMPFGSAGRARPGAARRRCWSTARRRWRATVRADGSLRCGRASGLDPPGRRGGAGGAEPATAGPSGMSSCRAGSCGCSTSTGPKCSASAEGLGRAAPSPVLAAPVSAPPRW